MYQKSALLIGAVFVSFFVTALLFYVGHELGFYDVPDGQRAARVLEEAFARGILLNAAVAVTVLWFADGWKNQSVSRWQGFAIAVVWLGLLLALGDPFHALRSEGTG